MHESTQVMLRSELYGVTHYLERLNFALSQMSQLNHLPSVKEACYELVIEQRNFFQEMIESDFFVIEKKIDTEKFRKDPLGYLAHELKHFTALMTHLLQLPINGEKTIEMVCQYINLLYQHAWAFHQIVEFNTDFEVPLPRMNLIEILEKSSELDPEELPQFFLDASAVKSFHQQTKGDEILALDQQREKKYAELISLGHQMMAEKKYQKSLEYFMRAHSFHSTAEALTLIAQSYSLMGEAQKAKSYCLQAIRKDPHYGAAYNDLGNYLLSEGQINESLKWFELAKKSSDYNNREFPYINAGRAYIAKKDFNNALEQFHRALEIAPFNQHLFQTVEKLKNTLKGSKISSQDHPSAPL